MFEPPVFVLFLLFPILFTIVESQIVCMNSAGNHTTTTSTFRANLDTALSSLPTSVNTTGFYSASSGRSPDRVHATVLCRGDVALDICRSCIQNATVDLMNSPCHSRKQGAIWKEECMLRFSNETLYGSVVISTRFWMWNPNNASGPGQFREDLTRLMENLRDEAAAGGDLRKVAGGNVTASEQQTIFGLVQCTPDLSAEDCRKCINIALGDIPKCCDSKIGGRVLLPSCNVRFETRPFFNQTRLQELAVVRSAPAPVPQAARPVTQPLGGNKGYKTWNITIFVSIILPFIASMII